VQQQYCAAGVAVVVLSASSAVGGFTNKSNNWGTARQSEFPLPLRTKPKKAALTVTAGVDLARKGAASTKALLAGFP